MSLHGANRPAPGSFAGRHRPRRSVGIAVIGSSGHAARVAAPLVAQEQQASLVGVLGSTPERGAVLAESYAGARAYADWRELAADDAVEAVWVAGPNHRHVEFATSCLEANKHVLLEKPMATTERGARELQELAARRERLLMVGFQHRFRPAHRWLRQELANGRAGEVKLLRVHRFWPFPYFEDMPADPSLSWRSSLSDSGGWALNDIGSHLIDLAVWLLGTGARLAYARTSNFKFHDAAAEDSALLLLETDAGALITIETSNAMASFPGTIEVHGSGGWMRADGTFDGGGSILTDTGERERFPDLAPLEATALALRDFLAGIDGSPTIGASAAEAADNVAIVEAAVAGHRKLANDL
jgi:1,5-anhydro-D-fructose reductase (1,5-anhydro-D-mannitol-forming)